MRTRSRPESSRSRCSGIAVSRHLRSISSPSPFRSPAVTTRRSFGNPDPERAADARDQSRGDELQVQVPGGPLLRIRETLHRPGARLDRPLVGGVDGLRQPLSKPSREDGHELGETGPVRRLLRGPLVLLDHRLRILVDEFRERVRETGRPFASFDPHIPGAIVAPQAAMPVSIATARRPGLPSAKASNHARSDSSTLTSDAASQRSMVDGSSVRKGTRRHRLRTVGSSRSSRVVTSMMTVRGAGSSRVFSRAFWPC